MEFFLLVQIIKYLWFWSRTENNYSQGIFLFFSMYFRFLLQDHYSIFILHFHDTFFSVNWNHRYFCSFGPTSGIITKTPNRILRDYIYLNNSKAMVELGAWEGGTILLMPWPMGHGHGDNVLLIVLCSRRPTVTLHTNTVYTTLSTGYTSHKFTKYNQPCQLIINTLPIYIVSLQSELQPY